MAGAPLTALFASPEEAREAIQSLEAGGVDSASISVVTRASKDAVALERDTGASDDIEGASVHRNPLGKFVEWLGRLESVTVPGFGGVLVTGDVWRDLHGGDSGRGSITGALVGCGVEVDEAARLEQAVLDGGQTLVVVHGSYDAAAVRRVFAA